MRLREILTEKINITRYYAQVYEIVMDVVKEKSDQGDIAIKHEIINRLEPLLQKIAQTYAPSTPYAEGISLEFSPMQSDNRGMADGMTVIVNTTEIDHVIQEYQRGHKIHNPISDLASTIIHELVHVLQHIPQYDKQRYDTEYKSYAGAKEKMYQELRDGEPGVLYYSSPQEIGAFAHNFAIDLISKIKETGLPRNFDEILRRRMIGQMRPTVYNQLSPRVIQRYAKKTYEELSHLISYGAARKARTEHEELYQLIKSQIAESFDGFRDEVMIYIDDLFYKDHPHTTSQIETDLKSIADAYRRNLIDTIRSHMKSIRQPVSVINRFSPDSITMYDAFIREVEFQYNATIGYIQDLNLDSDQMKTELVNKLNSNTLLRDIVTDQTDVSVSILYDRANQLRQQLGNWIGLND